MGTNDSRLGHRLALSVMPALLCGGVSLADDAAKIADAQAACVKLTKAHLSAVSARDDVVFDDAANVSSDPSENAFEFHWKMAFCKGDANRRKITQLLVRDEMLACEISTDPRLTASCELAY
jgi:hypothetical protein